MGGDAARCLPPASPPTPRFRPAEGHLSGSDRPDGGDGGPPGRSWGDLDAIYSGFLGSAGQIGLIEDFYRQFRREDAGVVDPVMGDHGKPYRTYTPELCGRMRDLAAQADVITPNLTEAALLMEDYADPAPGTRGAAGVAGAAEPGWAALGGAHRGEPPAGRHRRAASTGPQGASVLLWPGRSRPSSRQHRRPFRQRGAGGRCSGEPLETARPSGRRSLSSGAQPTPWRWAPRFWRGSSSSPLLGQLMQR